MESIKNIENIEKNIAKFLRDEELAALKLRALYGLNGYSGYRMNKFEEYEFYIRNKDFLVSENVLTFTDVNGKLMALKPDVTLSIVRHIKDEPDKLKKFFYDENVYRVSGNSKTFREIKQAGVECIGAVTDKNVYEVIALAAESLKVLSGSEERRVVLNIANLGFLEDLISSVKFNRDEIIKYIAAKNIDALTEICGGDVVADNREGLEILKLINLSCLDLYETLNNLKNFNKPEYEKYIVQLEDMIKFFERYNPELLSMLKIDFSVISDLNYYNGLAFQGFIEGIPARILSGGQYDKLMRKFGHKSGAVGFAVYLDMMGRVR